MTALPDRPLCLLIAAMGGEGGGGIDPLGSEGGRLLLKWITAAAAARGFPAQSTLMPGTTQRTGSTTYYVELYPAVQSALEGRWPVFRTSARPGDIDLIAAYELLEGARVLQQGFASPERTTFIASTHRAYSIIEKISTRDGRFDSRRAIEAARECCKETLLFDMPRIVRQSGGSQNAAMLGAIAASGVLPLTKADFSAAIDSVGFDVGTNLAAFDLAFEAAAEAVGRLPQPAQAGKNWDTTPETPALADAEARYPAAAIAIVREGFRRAIDFQDKAYARLYLKRLDAILNLDARGQGPEDDYKLTRETGRYLATWMAYEDVIRVADLKIRRARYARVRKDVGAGAGEPVRITEYLKPGLEELCSILSPWLARRILAAADRRGLRERLHIGLHVKSTNVTGFMLLRLMSWARILRQRGYRYQEEQRLIEEWLDAVVRAEERNHELALEIVECARLMKGYGDTRRRAVNSLRSILGEVVAPALAGKADCRDASKKVRLAREAAFAHPEGDGFNQVLKGLMGAERRKPVAETVAAD